MAVRRREEWGRAVEWERMRKTGRVERVRRTFEPRRTEVEVLMVLRRWGRMRPMDIERKMGEWRGGGRWVNSIRESLAGMYRKGWVEKWVWRGGRGGSGPMVYYWLTEEGMEESGRVLGWFRRMLEEVEWGERAI